MKKGPRSLLRRPCEAFLGRLGGRRWIFGDFGSQKGAKRDAKIDQKPPKTDAKFQRFFRSPPGAHFRALCAENDAKIDPKWSRNLVRERKRRFFEKVLNPLRLPVKIKGQTLRKSFEINENRPKNDAKTEVGKKRGPESVF